MTEAEAQMQELEQTYGLNFCIKTSEPEELLKKVAEFINMSDLKEVFRQRSRKLLADKIDVSAFLIWFMENYPESYEIVCNQPDHQYIFK